eukprot:TRINITY_DN105278_c0_g1_i1.p1 TRINITY_DN105278_c0_g1~~TRINITY_DN105278_c0_g1_i1.p1  ORF type:complete len:389 (+),score=12.93 TRINITY_DN105278_c0_g1_i1:88-1167(+)
MGDNPPVPINEYSQLSLEAKPVPILKIKGASSYHLPHDRSYSHVLHPAKLQRNSTDGQNFEQSFDSLRYNSFLLNSSTTIEPTEESTHPLSQFAKLCNLLRIRNNSTLTYHKPLLKPSHHKIRLPPVEKDTISKLRLSKKKHSVPPTENERSRILELIFGKQHVKKTVDRTLVISQRKLQPLKRPPHIKLKKVLEKSSHSNKSTKVGKSYVKDTSPYCSINETLLEDTQKLYKRKTRQKFWLQRLARSEAKCDNSRLLQFLPGFVKQKTLVPKIVGTLRTEGKKESTQKFQPEETKEEWQKCEFKVYIHRKSKNKGSGHCTNNLSVDISSPVDTADTQWYINIQQTHAYSSERTTYYVH